MKAEDRIAKAMRLADEYARRANGIGDPRTTRAALETYLRAPVEGVRHLAQSGDELARDPDGDVALDWRVGDSLLSISVAPDGRAAYAWNLADGRKEHGTVALGSGAYVVLDGAALAATRQPALVGMPVARPLSEWFEDDGAALWWVFPVEEAPYSGTPLDSRWPFYHTHWTPIEVPAAPPEAAPGGSHG